RRPPPELAVPRRSDGRGHLPPAAHRPRRDADALLLRSDRPEIPDRRAAVAARAVRALSLARRDAGGAGRDPRRADRRRAAGRAGRFGVGAAGPLLVPARGPGDQKAALVRARRFRGVGAGGAQRPGAGAARELGRPPRRSTITASGGSCSRALLPRPTRLTMFSLRQVARSPWRCLRGTVPTGNTVPAWP